MMGNPSAIDETPETASQLVSMRYASDLQRALAIVAWCVLKYGAAYAPLLDRLELEVRQEHLRAGYQERAAVLLRSVLLRCQPSGDESPEAGTAEDTRVLRLLAGSAPIGSR